MTLEEALEQVRLLTAERDAANAQVTAITKERDSVRAKLTQATTDLQTVRAEATTAAEKAASEHEAALAVLSAQHADALATASTSATRELVAAEAKALAATMGMRDPTDAVRLLDLTAFTRAQDGAITGLAEAVGALKESKGYLFGGASAPPSTSGAPPASAPALPPMGGTTFNAVTATDAECKARASQLGINLAEI